MTSALIHETFCNLAATVIPLVTSAIIKYSVDLPSSSENRRKCIMYVRSTAHHAIHFQFGISANAFGINAVRSPNCIV
jgi:hypothetical protein